MLAALVSKATSTPYSSNEAKQEVLKEKKQRNKNEQLQLNQKLFKGKSPLNQTPKKSKENIRRSSNTPKSSNEKNLKKEEEKRLAAIAAMKIQESRRQRMMSQQDDDEDVKTESNFSAQKDSLAEKKRLEAKKAKEKRILSFLEEQAKKKKQVEAAVKIDEPQVEQQVQQATQKLNKIVLSKFRPMIKCSYKPRIFGPHSAQEMVSAPKVPVYASTLSTLVETRPHAVTKRYVIRYSKDEIRSLNPYGYYFMWTRKLPLKLQVDNQSTYLFIQMRLKTIEWIIKHKQNTTFFVFKNRRSFEKLKNIIISAYERRRNDKQQRDRSGCFELIKASEIFFDELIFPFDFLWKTFILTSLTLREFSSFQL